MGGFKIAHNQIGYGRGWFGAYGKKKKKKFFYSNVILLSLIIVQRKLSAILYFMTINWFPFNLLLSGHLNGGFRWESTLEVIIFSFAQKESIILIHMHKQCEYT